MNGRKTDLTEFWIVNRKALLWPPEPLSFLGCHLIHKGLRLWDHFEEEHLAAVDKLLLRQSAAFQRVKGI